MPLPPIWTHILRFFIVFAIVELLAFDVINGFWFIYVRNFYLLFCGFVFYGYELKLVYWLRCDLDVTLSFYLDFDVDLRSHVFVFRDNEVFYACAKLVILQILFRGGE